MKRMRWTAWLAALALLAGAGSTHAGFVVIGPSSVGEGKDGPPKDGTFDTLQVNPAEIQIQQSSFERRGAMEFSLGSIPDGATITSAVLQLTVTSATGTPIIQVHGFSGDGAVTLADMTIANLVAGPFDNTAPGLATKLASIDVTAFVQSIFGSADFAGFMLQNLATSSSLVKINTTNTEGGPVLRIDFQEPRVEDPELPPPQHSPEPGSLVLLGMGCLGLGLCTRRRPRLA